MTAGDLLVAVEALAALPLEAPPAQAAAIAARLCGAARSTFFPAAGDGTIGRTGSRIDGTRATRLTPSACDLLPLYVGRNIDGLIPFYDVLPGWWISVQVTAGARVQGALVLDDIEREPPEHQVRALRSFAMVMGLRMELARDVERHRRTASTDQLTGLSTRVVAKEALERALAERGAAGVVLIDLDHFKAINDSQGHAAGDEVLRRAARALQTAMRAGDVVARWGGDEFVVVTSASAQVIATRIHQCLTDAGIAASIGAAQAPEDGHQDDTLVACADARMYQQKSHRRRAPAR